MGVVCVAVAGALLVKEDVALVIVPLGLWVAAQRDRRIGLVTAGAAVLTTVIAMFVVMRSLIGVPTRNAWRIPFGGPSGFSQRCSPVLEMWRHISLLRAGLGTSYK